MQVNGKLHDKLTVPPDLDAKAAGTGGPGGRRCVASSREAGASDRCAGKLVNLVVS